MKLVKLLAGIELLTLLFLLVPALSSPSLAAPENSPSQTIYTVGESYEFSTRVLSDPWDMSEFYDISQWINHLRSDKHLLNIQVADGIFSAATQSTYSEFYPLFPGYLPGALSGKIGALYPIDSSRFSCFYTAMSATWSLPTTNYFMVAWIKDKDITQWNNPDGPWGAALSDYMTSGRWELHRIALNDPKVLINQPWSYLTSWQALRVTPSILADTQFSVDWIRLTDCQPVYVTLTNIPQGNFDLWIGTGTPERQILVVENFNANTDRSYLWDVQGIAPGTYAYYIKPTGGSTAIQQGELEVVDAPIVTFTRPSPTSGSDYATQAGNTWDMESSDVIKWACSDFSFNDGVLDIYTQPPANLPGNCVGPGAGEADPRIWINTPDHGDLSSFRYFSFSSYTSGQWSVPEQGMIVRWIWRLERPGDDCYYISHAFALEVGWHTYWVDLYNPRNGTPEEYYPSSCPYITWKDQAQVGPLIEFRMDPNENILDEVLHQKFDWLRLTQIDQAQPSRAFDVRVLLSKAYEELESLTFYYTTDPNQPTQYAAQPYVPPYLDGEYLRYLPLTLLGAPSVELPPPEADLIFKWDTTSAPAGNYYVCAQADDGYNVTHYCSQAPVAVNKP
ncbi:MAG: hypothetical protein JW726_01950 [Anaerolineales bacterium]|nr:hypothetical protein [Anaerolineales bacterium]